jgi:aspartyl protease family protein
MKKLPQNNNPHSSPARMMFILTWVALFFLMIVLFNFSQRSDEAQVIVEHNRLVINADNKGHYVLNGMLNNMQVKFLIDTGATSLAIPEEIASKLKLVKRYPVTIGTASGQSQAYLTRVKHVKLGTIEMKNVKAIILPDKKSNFVLLGMNVLKELSMTIRNNQLIIERVQ